MRFDGKFIAADAHYDINLDAFVISFMVRRGTDPGEARVLRIAIDYDDGWTEIGNKLVRAGDAALSEAMRKDLGIPPERTP